MSLTYVTITGTFDDGSGTALNGIVTFAPSSTVYAAGVPLVTTGSPIVTQVTGGALQSVRLLATDNAGLTFDGLTGFFYWTVTVNFNGVQAEPWSFFLPSSPSTVDLFALADTGAGSGGGGGGISPPAGDIGGSTSVPTVVSTHLTAALPLAQGGTGQASQQAAIDALAGAVTSGLVLRGNGTHIALAAIQAGDVPTLNQDTTGKSAKTDALDSATTVVNVAAATAPSSGQVLTATDSTHATWQPAAGGVSSLTFTFGSTGAVPSSGTFTTGAVAIDQNEVLRVCTAGGTPGTWRRAYARPWQFYVDDYGAKGDGVECLVTTTATSPTVTATTSVFTNTGVDGGKNIMICGAGGAVPGGPDIDTISAVTSGTVATLTSNVPAGGSGSGLACVFSTDDRVAIDNCITAASAYAQAHSYTSEVIFSDKIYGLGTTMFQSAAGVSGALLTYNTQVRIPVPADLTGESGKLETRFIGAGNGGTCQFWTAKNLVAPGTMLVSYSSGPNTADATFGQQSIVGGPTGGTGIGNDNGFFAAKAVVKGITVVQPGWSNSIGLDAEWMAALVVDGVNSTAFAPATSLGGGINPYAGPVNPWFSQAFWINNKIAAGFRVPTGQNNDEVVLTSAVVQGLNIGVITSGDHVIFDRLSIAAVDVVFRMPLGGNTQHEIEGRVSAENYNVGILTVGSGSRVMCNLTWDAEETSTTIAGSDVNDASGNLFGNIQWSDFSRSTGGLANIIIPTVTGAQNLRIHNVQLTHQVYDAHAYAYTLGTAFQNPWWEDVWVQLAGGTVTNVQVGPTSAAATTSLATATPTTFRLPSGWWLNITGTVKPTTFVAIPD